MSTVFIIHGTEGHPDKNWYQSVKKELEQEGFEIVVPTFPSPKDEPASLSEWLDELDVYNAKITPETIFVGHSLGGIFILRLLEILKHQIKAAIFVGTPIGIQPMPNYERDKLFSEGKDFNFDWDAIRMNASKRIVFQGKDDQWVPLENGIKLAENLGEGTEQHIVANAGHFTTSSGYTEFPELLEIMKGLK